MTRHQLMYIISSSSSFIFIVQFKSFQIFHLPLGLCKNKFRSAPYKYFVESNFIF